jgi:hypothetical protein
MSIMETVAALFSLVLVVAACIALFLFTYAPCFIAYHRKTGNTLLCFALLFIPFVGWFYSLYRALTDPPAIDLSDIVR